jgi:hypothetical protein
MKQTDILKNTPILVLKLNIKRDCEHSTLSTGLGRIPKKSIIARRNAFRDVYNDKYIECACAVQVQTSCSPRVAVGHFILKLLCMPKEDKFKNRVQ